ncbi:type I restriction-modification system subunit M [bacterium]|nr:type I restriction-modification system subunit M [bacterium]
MLQNNPAIKAKINLLWDKIWSGGIANPLTAIEQITYLLFIKQLDTLYLKTKSDSEFTGETYATKFDGYWVPPEFRNMPEEDQEKYRIKKDDLRWSNIKRITSTEEMSAHVQTRVFPFIKELNGGTSAFTKHMSNAVFMIASPILLKEAMGSIDEIFEEIEKDAKDGKQTFQDIQGDVYEYLLSEIASAGKNGQFRTPRHIIKLMSELVAPQLGQRIGDPASGTAGFLLGAYQYIVTQLNKNKAEIPPDEDGFVRTISSHLLTEQVKQTLEQSIFGFDFDVTMVRLGLMNLMMHGLDVPQVNYADTLGKGFDEKGFDIVMANPPFTGSINKGNINEDLKLDTTKTELLFIERIHNMLRSGGTAAVIVPQGVLFGAGKAFVATRKILIEKSELKAVITMPSGVFKPYAGVSTAILVFTKGGETETVWFYEMLNDGYSLDDKRAKLEGYGDLQDIAEKFKNRDPQKESDRTQKCFFVPKSEIVAENYDLSLSRYKEDVFEEIEYEKPDAIFKKLKDFESEIATELKDLEGMLG